MHQLEVRILLKAFIFTMICDYTVFIYFKDPLAFKPNPHALINSDVDGREGVSGGKELDEPDEGDGIYRPPRLAPMPYLEKSKKQSRRDRPPVPAALATLSADPYRPYEETTSGLGGAPSLASTRAKHLQRIQDYEEENFTRLIMKKSEAKRRARDEEDLALGGDLGGASGRRSRAGGLEDEFGDILRSVSRVSGVRSQGDGYDELRKRGKKMAILDRSRQPKRDSAQVDDSDEAPRLQKRSRFELEMKSVKRKLKQRR
jgi:U3 small nucleolar ribonucleoprotein protein LCP5